MLGEASRTTGSMFTQLWYLVNAFSARILVWYVYQNHIRSYVVAAWGFGVHGLPEDLIFPFRSSWHLGCAVQGEIKCLMIRLTPAGALLQV